MTTIKGFLREAWGVHYLDFIDKMA